jgi:hypothetical protein
MESKQRSDVPAPVRISAEMNRRFPTAKGFRHHGKPIVGMIATLFDAPSGLSLMLTLIPQTVRSIDDDLDRLQFHLTETSLRERLLRDIGDHGTRSAEFRETLDELAKAGDVPHEKSRTSKRTFPTPHCPTCHACAPIRGTTVMSTVRRY